MTIVVGVVLVAAAVLQLVAVALAVRALPHSGPYRYLWIALSLALLLMVQRRIGALMHLPEVPHGAGDAFLAFAISALMVFSMAGLARMLVALRHSQDELTRLATTDALTGLASRRHLLEELERELQRAARSERPVGVLMIDIDRFKAINDSLGHANGDAVLVALASRIRLVLRAIDTCGRIGGEEFVVVLPDTDLEGALRTGERLREAMACAPVLTASGPVDVTISLGVAVHEPTARPADARRGARRWSTSPTRCCSAPTRRSTVRSRGTKPRRGERPGGISPVAGTTRDRRLKHRPRRALPAAARVARGCQSAARCSRRSRAMTCSASPSGPSARSAWPSFSRPNRPMRNVRKSAPSSHWSGTPAAVCRPSVANAAPLCIAGSSV